MSTLSQNVKQAIHDFDDIKDAIEYKGVDVPTGTSTSEYSEKIKNIETGITPIGTIEITENGEGIDISQYANADVNVPQGVFPSGTLEITSNGTVDVTSFEFANVHTTSDEDLRRVLDGTIQTLNVPDGTESISPYTFYQDRNLREITLPSSVQSIDSYAFYGCHSLSNINWSDNITAIWEYAFTGCNSLFELYIPNNVICVGDCAFSSLSNISILSLPQSLKFIGFELFSTQSNTTEIITNTSAFNVTFRELLNNFNVSAIYINDINDWCNNLNIEIYSYDTYFSDYCIYVDNSLLLNLEVSADVDKISPYAFCGCSCIETIDIQNSNVHTIEDHAFEYATSLQTVILGNHINSIGDYAFDRCGQLTNLVIPQSVTKIGVRAFYNTNLETVTLPIGIEKVGQSAFRNTPWWKSQIDNQFVYIDHVAYAYKGSEPSYEFSFNIPEGITVIADGAFSRCYELTSIDLPTSLRHIGDSAFSMCSKLTICSLPEGLQTIGQRAFTECQKITSIAIPNSVATIESSAFNNCQNLASVTLSEGLVKIEDQAFYSCSNLATINFPSTLSYVGMSAFDYTAWYSSQPNGLVYINDILYAYKGTMPNNTSITIPEGKSISPNFYFSYNTALISLTIPSTAEIIPSCFECTNLKQFILYSGTCLATTIGDNHFYNCRSLTRIDLPQNLQHIGSGVFYSCTNLTNLDFPATLETIGDGAFSNTGLITLNLQNTSITKLSRNMCIQCYSLETVNLPPNVVSLGISVFDSCSSITSIHLPNSVEYIERNAFASCSALSEVYMSSSIKYIGNNAFAACYSLQNIYYPGTESQWKQIVISPDNFTSPNITIHYNHVFEE